MIQNKIIFTNHEQEVSAGHHYGMLSRHFAEDLEDVSTYVTKYPIIVISRSNLMQTVYVEMNKNCSISQRNKLKLSLGITEDFINKQFSSNNDYTIFCIDFKDLEVK